MSWWAIGVILSAAECPAWVCDANHGINLQDSSFIHLPTDTWSQTWSNIYACGSTTERKMPKNLTNSESSYHYLTQLYKCVERYHASDNKLFMNWRQISHRNKPLSTAKLPTSYHLDLSLKITHYTIILPRRCRYAIYRTLLWTIHEKQVAQW